MRFMNDKRIQATDVDELIFGMGETTIISER